ncbi:MAG: hypothetical protein WB812_15060 [Woeseiaceae bacterium]
MTRAAALGLFAPLLLAACQTAATADDRPARIVEPDAASRAALQRAVNDALNTDVALADDALTDSSLLIIERNPPKSMGSPPAQGRIMEAPIQFQLVTDGTHCLLVDRRDDSRRVLEDTRCAAE